MQKVSISPQGGSKFSALFNPTEYGLDKGNTIAEIAIPGLSVPVLQFVHGGARSLSMELYFDTYEERTSVTEHTKRVYELLEIVGSTHAPPICDIEWGRFTFRGVLEKVTGRFTLFLDDGTPVRATLNVSFKEYVPVEVAVKERPTESADHEKSRTVVGGDRLDLIAGEEYGDAAQWRAIARANALDDPRSLRPGTVLRIPELPYSEETGR